MLASVAACMRPWFLRIDTLFSARDWNRATSALTETMVRLAQILVVSNAGGQGKTVRRANDLRNNVRRQNAAMWGTVAETEAAIDAQEEAKAAAAAAEFSGFADVRPADGDYHSGSDDDEDQPDAHATSQAHKAASAASHSAFRASYVPPATDAMLAKPDAAARTSEEIEAEGKRIETLIRRIVALLDRTGPGNTGKSIIKAVQSLLNPPPIKVSDENDSRLQDLLKQHPEGDLASIPPLPANAPPIIVTTEQVLDALKACAGPLAAGMSGVSGTVLHQLATVDDTIAHSLTTLISVILNASSPDLRLHAFLTAGKATLLAKAGSAPSQRELADSYLGNSASEALRDLLQSNRSNADAHKGEKFRTITVGEVLLKVAGKVALAKLDPADVLKAIGPLQIGVGTPSGVEQYLLNIHTALELHANDPEIIAMAFDIADAFMRANRAKMLQALFEQGGLSPLWRLAHWHMSNRNPRFLHMSNGSVYSFFQSEGGPQGDPLMPLLFSLLIAKLHALVISKQTVAAAKACLDDTMVVAKVQVMEVIYKEMAQRSEEVCGFKLNESKCIVTSVHPDPSPLVPAFVATHGFKFDHGSTTAVGGTVGVDEARMKAWLVDQVREHAQLFRVLSHPNMRAWLVHRMLRVVLLPRMTFLLRTHSPELLRDATQLFDKCVLEVFAQRFNLPEVAPSSSAEYQADPRARNAQKQTCLPVNNMGMGITPTELVCHTASLAGLAAAAPAVLEAIEAYRARALPPASGSVSSAAASKPVMPQLPITARRLYACSAFMTKYASKVVSEKNLPHTLPDFLQFFSASDRKAPSAHFQGVFTRAVTAHLADELRAAALSDADKCRLTSLSIKRAQSFLDASADEPATRLPDAEYQAMARLHLGLPASPELRNLPTARCACGFLLRHDPVNHFMTCKKTNQSEIIGRHDRLNKTMQRLADELGIAPIHERILANNKRLDGDYVLSHLAKVIATDWSVAHPAASSYSSTQAVSVPGYASLHRANRKIVKYDAQVKKEGGVFLPLIVETFGGFHQNVIKLLIEFRKAAELTGHPNVPDVETLRHRLSAALVKGNYKIVQNGLAKMRRAD